MTQQSGGSLTQSTLELNVPGLSLSAVGPDEVLSFLLHAPQEDEGFGDVDHR